MVKRFEWPDYACPKCDLHQQWMVRSCTNAGGQRTCLFVCGHCDHRTQHFVKVKLVKAAGIEPLPIEATSALPVCEVCGALGAEQHHWAPSALFGLEAESWPKAHLCQPCHAKWHRIVTPNMRCTD